jgi:hypothetical protein
VGGLINRRPRILVTLKSLDAGNGFAIKRPVPHQALLKANEQGALDNNPRLRGHSKKARRQDDRGKTQEISCEEREKHRRGASHHKEGS